MFFISQTLIVATAALFWKFLDLDDGKKCKQTTRFIHHYMLKGDIATHKTLISSTIQFWNSCGKAGKNSDDV